MRTINDGFPIKQFKGIDIDTSIQSSSANYYTYSSRVVKFIVIHYTGNTKDTAKAKEYYEKIKSLYPDSNQIENVNLALENLNSTT